jgi:hypothetical protein
LEILIETSPEIFGTTIKKLKLLPTKLCHDQEEESIFILTQKATTREIGESLLPICCRAGQVVKQNR